MRWRLTPWVVCVLAPVATWADVAPGDGLTAEALIEKNVAARGGLDAWRKIDTMIWTGRLEGEHAPVQGMPFVMQQKRPNKTRFEISVMGKRTLRVFDGTHGWKAQASATGPDVTPYTPQETTFAFRAPGIDGPLIDYQAKRSTVTLEGVDEIDGRKAYRLKVERVSGEIDHVWIDADTYLDVRYDRPSYAPAGAATTVTVFYQDYKPVDGLQIPSVVETAVGASRTRDRMVIERILVNTPVEEREFARPGGPVHRGSFATAPQPGRNAGGGASVAPAVAAPDQPVGPK